MFMLQTCNNVVVPLNEIYVINNKNNSATLLVLLPTTITITTTYLIYVYEVVVLWVVDGANQSHDLSDLSAVQREDKHDPRRVGDLRSRGSHQRSNILLLL